MIDPLLSLAPIASTSNPSHLSTSPSPLSSSTRTSDFTEEYLLLLLSDSNLPTGGFVASSGLESFIQHGYLSSSSSSHGKGSGSVGEEKEIGLVEFVKKSLDNYSRGNSNVLLETHRIVSNHLSSLGKGKQPRQEEDEQTMRRLLEMDRLVEDMILNQITKRSSIAQGNALLSLYSRALAPLNDESASGLVERIRGEIRDGGKGWKGHQTTSFGIVMALVGLSLHRSIHLFLFLHARSILSSAVRLNILGPYSAHRLLLWDVKELVRKTVEEIIAGIEEGAEEVQMEEEESQDWWETDEEWAFLRENGGVKGIEATNTWPLGEIVASRHDQLFTKVFNS
ncbi:urease accessory protein UreF [Sporobolomyces salmoneus]|uniref:urease accessory protein UreF n=1 Tax=Sporobolomyces salmoneus TaxID=183962 RepID=UPI003171EC6F